MRETSFRNPELVAYVNTVDPFTSSRAHNNLYIALSFSVRIVATCLVEWSNIPHAKRITSAKEVVFSSALAGLFVC